MNVLLTSAGRRVSLLRLFQQATEASGGRVFVSDIDPGAPTLQFAPFLQLPPVSADGYGPALLAAASEHRIDLVVPTIDPELPVLALLADDLAAVGTRAVISTPDFVATCSDKWLFHAAFAAEGVRTPRSWLPAELPDDLPRRLFVKPRRGSASKGISALTVEDARAGNLPPNAEDPIIQEFVGGTELTIDAFLSRDGRPLHAVPRERRYTIGGESVQGVTVAYEPLRGWLESVLATCGRLGARGPITLQAFLAPDGPVLFEINPRLGGGFPLADAAGGHYPAWLVDEASGADLPSRLGEYQVGLYMTRYHSELFVTDLPW